MTKEQIEKKAKEIANQWQEPSDYNIARDAATEMAEWLLSHLWVSVDDELPPAIEEDNTTSVRVIVQNENDAVFVDAYNFQRKEWRMGKVSIFKVTHWMPIPPLAEEGGEK